ncbi:MAG: serine/threonine protein kinase, partial [Bradymonadaceae bacterium]
MEPTRIHGLEIFEGVVIEDRYEIRRKLGAGGFAQVFAAHDRNVEREVAIKFLDVHTGERPPDQVANILARFKLEAKVAAQLGHPNVVNVFDFGVLEADGPVPYIVMEFLTGHDLDAHLVREGPMEARRAVELFIPCLEGLGEAHKLSIVHKDLKPANLFLVKPGERGETLRIVDFGVAHFDADKLGSRLTATGEILGTPQYLPPEYINKQLVSPAFDVYQMGLILAEVISGKTVVNESNPFRCIMRHAQGDLNIPAPWPETILGPVLKRALSLEHTDRYADGYAMADALAALDLNALPSREELAAWKESGSTEELRSSSEMLASKIGTDVSAKKPEPIHSEIAFDKTLGGVRPERLGAGQTQKGAGVEAAPDPEPGMRANASQGETQQAERSSSAKPDATPVAASPDRKAALWALAGGVVLALIMLIFLLVSSSEDGVQAEPIAAQVEEVEEALEIEAVQVPDEAPVEAGEAEPVMIRVEVEPSTAQVFVNTMSLGRSPSSIQFGGPDDDVIEVEVRAPGYETMKFELGPDAGPVHRVVLTKVPEPK